MISRTNIWHNHQNKRNVLTWVLTLRYCDVNHTQYLVKNRKVLIPLIRAPINSNVFPSTNSNFQIENQKLQLNKFPTYRRIIFLPEIPVKISHYFLNRWIRLYSNAKTHKIYHFNKSSFMIIHLMVHRKK